MGGLILSMKADYQPVVVLGFVPQMFQYIFKIVIFWGTKIRDCRKERKDWKGFLCM
jgi:hypothetical protein